MWLHLNNIKGGMYVKKFLAVFLSLVMILPQFTLTAFASDEVTIYIDGQKMNFSQGAIVKNDRVLVPMREIFEKLNVIASDALAALFITLSSSIFLLEGFQ